MARLKAILLGGEIPSYDQFLQGSYNNILVDQYVYGFALISAANRKFGEDFWQKVIEKTTEFPHPFRFLSSFEEISGQTFKDFYSETFEGLKASWKKDSFENGSEREYAKEGIPA